jgi:hypothetical protein
MPSELPLYVIDDDKENPTLNHRTLKILLRERISEAQLSNLALEFRKGRENYYKLWIFYHLPTMNSNKIAWATTHFAPELEVKILGASIDKEAALLKNLSDILESHAIEGKWKDDSHTFHTWVLFNQNGNSYLQAFYYETPYGNNNQIIKTNTAEGVRLDYVDNNPHGEYFIIANSGELKLFSKDGHYETAYKF